MSTSFPSGKNIVKSWRLIDAAGLTLGRLASNIAQILMGKDHPMYTPFLDLGDRVIVFNAERIVVSGKKRETKIYYRYTGYPGGLRREKLGDRLNDHPEEVVRDAVYGMLPKSKLGRRIKKKLRVFRADVPASFQEVNVRKRPSGLDSYSAFRARVIQDLREWITSLPPSRRVSKFVYVGTRSMRATELLGQIVDRSELGEKFLQTMYRLENEGRSESNERST
jgi:large subunit ribosomal protein L13